MNPSPRDSRQASLVPPEKVNSYRYLVVGNGAVGHPVATMLAAAGVHNLALVDHDTVEEVNLRPQMFPESALGGYKVAAVRDACLALSPKMNVLAFPEKFARSRVPTYVESDDSRPVCVFACVDSITVRRRIWETLKERAAFFVDGRTASEVIRVVTGGPHYESTLFEESEAHQGTCTARMTAYLGHGTAFLMLVQWSKFLRGMDLDPDTVLNTLGQEMFPYQETASPA